MSKAVLKLALEEMKVGNYNSAAERLEAALAEQPAGQQSCYCPNCEALSKELAEQPAQPQQEPCCHAGIAHDCHAGPGCRIVKRLKATPQPAQRQPLTEIPLLSDYENKKLSKDAAGNWALVLGDDHIRYLNRFERNFVDSAIEAAHCIKEKNT